MDRKFLEDGMIQTTLCDRNINQGTVTTGFLNENLENHGLCLIKEYNERFDILYSYEIAEFENGARHGKSTTYNPDNSIRDVTCYDHNNPIPCNKSAMIDSGNSSAFDILKQKFPWFYYQVISQDGMESAFKAYMDTIEMKLGNRVVDELKFDNSYNSVLTETNKIPEFDTIHNIVSSFTKFNFPDILRRDPLRLAVVDHYRSGKTIYDCVTATYPGYLRAINDKKISSPDFQEFCRVIDSMIISNGPINVNEPLFLDSVDTRLFRAINYLYFETKSATIGFTLTDVLNIGRNILAEAGIINQPQWITSSPHDVSKAVVNIIYSEITEADIVYFAVKESYFSGKNWVLLPTITTGLSNNNSQTSVTIRGNVIESGGADVTARGIAYAETYNPTVSDKTVSSGTGTGEFFAGINGLTAGVTYYARAYATNSKGTAYGNIIRFNTGTTVAKELNDTGITEMKVFPNPASASVTFMFNSLSAGKYELSIYNLSGQKVYSMDISHRIPGEFKKKVDLSGQSDGLYNCRLTNGKLNLGCKLLVKKS
jgi:hypothetical protein